MMRPQLLDLTRIDNGERIAEDLTPEEARFLARAWNREHRGAEWVKQTTRAERVANSRKTQEAGTC